MAVVYPERTDGTAGTDQSAPARRRVAFAVIAMFILLGPAPGQLFGMHSVLLREWLMFSGAGLGLLKGNFTLHGADGDVTMSPLEVAALPSYLALPVERRVFKPTDLKSFAARVCDNGRQTARLSYDGSVGTFNGWRMLTARDVCNDPAEAHYGDTNP
jgi:hypothetical protein